MCAISALVVTWLHIAMRLAYNTSSTALGSVASFSKREKEHPITVTLVCYVVVCKVDGAHQVDQRFHIFVVCDEHLALRL